MRHSVETMGSAQTIRRTVLGFPKEGFGLFQSVLISFAAALMAFWAATGIAIFSLLFWKFSANHPVNFADTYRYVGLPAGLIVLVVALPYFGFLWLRNKLRD